MPAIDRRALSPKVTRWVIFCSATPAQKMPKQSTLWSQEIPPNQPRTPPMHPYLQKLQTRNRTRVTASRHTGYPTVPTEPKIVFFCHSFSLLFHRYHLC